MEAILQAMFDVIQKKDDVSRMALADALEEAGMDDQAKKVRNDLVVLPDAVHYKVQEGREDYSVTIYMKDLVNHMVHQAKDNRNKRSERMAGRIVARSHYHTYQPLKTRRERQVKDQIPLSQLQDIKTTNRSPQQEETKGA